MVLRLPNGGTETTPPMVPPSTMFFKENNDAEHICIFVKRCVRKKSMFVKKYVRLLLCLYPRYYVSRQDFEFCKLQQQLFSAQVAKLYGGLLVLTAAFYLDDRAYAKALMLYHGTLTQTCRRCAS